MSDIVSTTTGDSFWLTLEGVDQVQAELDMMADDIRAKVQLEMMTNIGNQVKLWMQQNILAQGLLRTGNLFNSIFATVLTNDEGATLFVGPNLDSAPYARIQDMGGTVPAHWVFPVNAKALHWEQGGLDRFSKGHIVGIKNPITIQARPYIAPAFDDHQAEILDMMMEAIDAGIAEGMAGI